MNSGDIGVIGLSSTGRVNSICDVSAPNILTHINFERRRCTGCGDPRSKPAAGKKLDEGRLAAERWQLTLAVLNGEREL
jgi:hypothetical protein